MRKIEFQEPDQRAWRRWMRRCEDAQAADIAAVQAGEELEDSVLYKSQRAWFSNVEGPFRGKCAYCEQKIRGNQRGNIEHYRPKSAVKHLDWSYVAREVDGESERHPGYYWLRQTLSNLLLSCELCNQINADENGKYGKECRFPVDGDYAWNPGDEVTEHPLLLNPCFDDPAEHLELDPETGILTGISPRGEVTIDLLGLNFRDLHKDRKDAYDAAANSFYTAMGLMRYDPEAARRKLAELRDEESEPYASVRQAAIHACATSYREVATAGIRADVRP